MNNQLFTPAFPTTPVQDKFGQVHVNFGMSKIEYATIIIAGQLAALNSEKYLPETIAEEAYNVALNVYEIIDAEYKKAAAAASNNSGNIITDGKQAD
jgi:hypothetical protein